MAKEDVTEDRLQQQAQAQQAQQGPPHAQRSMYEAQHREHQLEKMARAAMMTPQEVEEGRARLATMEPGIRWRAPAVLVFPPAWKLAAGQESGEVVDTGEVEVGGCHVRRGGTGAEVPGEVEETGEVQVEGLGEVAQEQRGRRRVGKSRDRDGRRQRVGRTPRSSAATLLLSRACSSLLSWVFGFRV